MNYLSDVITYVRRLIKSPSDQTVPDSLIIDYINRFYTNDVPLRMQLFDLKSQYNQVLSPNVDKYNLPYFEIQTEPGNQQIAPYPIYQGLIPPAYVDGVQIPFMTSRDPFFKAYPDYTQNAVYAYGDGGASYTITIPTSGLNNGLVRGHLDVIGQTALNNGQTISQVPSPSIDSKVYLMALNANNIQMSVYDSGTFDPADNNVGILIGDGTGTVNYITGEINVVFNQSVPGNTPIQTDVVAYNSGYPRMCMFWNNILVLRPVPAQAYVFSCDAYITPAAFLNSANAIPFGYMSEYLARGAARKMLSDSGDVEQFQFYEPLFREQELLVWRRAERQFTTNRTPTIFSELNSQAPFNSGTNGGSN